MISLIVFGLFAINSYAAQPAQTFEDLCVYDKMCHQTMNADGSMITPKASLLKVMNELKTEIRVVSHKLGVDPRAVAGAIIAENSMNVQVDDDTHAFLEKIKSTKAADAVSKALRGKSFSLGLGQIKPDSAYEAEEMLAKMEKRPMYSKDRVTQELLNPVGSLKYAAAIVRHCQDEYAKQGMDVSGDPGVLASLYNLGRCEKLADKTKAGNRKPQVNYFGFFVNTYMKDVEKAVDYSKPYKDDEEKELNKVLSDDGSTTKSKFIKSFDAKTSLYAFPSQCSLGGGGKADEYQHDKSFVAPTAIAEGKGDYQIVSSGIDCDLEDWSLVKTKDGKIGWISNKDIDSKSSERLAGPGMLDSVFGGSEKKCDPAASADCKAKANKASDNKVLGINSAGMTEVKLIGKKDKPDDVDVKDFVPSCLREYGSYGGGMGYMSEAISHEEAQGMLEQVELKKEQIMASNGFKAWDVPQNQFKDFFARLDSLKECGEKTCTGSPRDIKAFLKEDMNKYKGFKGYMAFYNKFGDGFSINASKPIPDSEKPDNRKLWKDYIVSVEKSCAPFFKTSAKSEAAWTTIREKIKLDVPDDKLIPFSGSNDVPEACDLIQSTSATDPKAPTEAGFCADCKMSVRIKNNGGGYNGTTLTKEIVQSMVQTLDDQEAFFEGAMLSISQLNPGASMNYYTNGKNCKYDPMASAKRLEEILKLDCVEAVYVPDMFLVNKMRKYSGRVLYKPTDNDDRFAYTVKNGCSETSK
ncbi:MAG: DUF1402 family protein [Bdellovibrionales bacterium]